MKWYKYWTKWYIYNNPFKKYGHVLNILPSCLLQHLSLTQSWGKCSQTIWYHSCAQVILAWKILHPILSVCSSQSNLSKHLKLRFLVTFGTCYSSQMPSSRLKCGKKLRNISPSRFVSTALHKSLLQANIRRVVYVNFECLFWHAFKTRILGTL